MANHESWGVHDTQTGMPLGIAKGRKVRSKIRWFTEFCNSHYLSHFAAFFIDARAKRSVAESCIYILYSNILNIFRGCEGKHRPENTRKSWLKHSSPQSIQDNQKSSRPTICAQWGKSKDDKCAHAQGSQQQPDQVYSIMILPQVHLRKPCYDFYFL